MTFTEPKSFEEYNAGGGFGPNDGAYECFGLEKVAEGIRNCCWSVVGYSHSGNVDMNHRLVLAMKLIAEEHREKVYMANKGHDPKLFEIPDLCFVTPEEHWKPHEGPPGDRNHIEQTNST